MSFFQFLMVAALALSLAWCAVSEFTVVQPDSSTLVNRPQTSFSSLARTDPDEQKAVYDVMDATGNSWVTSIPDICRGRWHGIECVPDAADVYHVVSLSFGALSDDTAFPTCDAARPYLHPSLLRLPHLRALFLYRCLSAAPQPIPAFLGRLAPTLRSLVLRDNGHVGPIPAELGNLSSLQLLDLHSNNLHSSIPASLGTLTHLQLLDLSSNQLTGPIPDLALSNLNILDLSHNHLRGQLTTNTLTHCESLFKLDLSQNQLVGPIPNSLATLESLILLDMSHNHLSGPLPSSFPVSLRTLVLKGNPMGSQMVGFVGMKELSTLVMSDMDLQGGIPETMGELQSLRVLHLDGNRLNGTIPPSVVKLVKLSELRVNDNQLTGPIPFGREVMWRMGRKLRVYNNSGLCYVGIDALSGIDRCELDATRAAAGAAAGDGSGSLKHLSSSSMNQSSMTSHFSSSESGRRYSSAVTELVLIAGLLVPALLVLL